MRATVFNLAVLVGTLLIGAGVGIEYGIGRGLWVGGAIVVLLTIIGALVAGVTAAKAKGDVSQ